MAKRNQKNVSPGILPVLPPGRYQPRSVKNVTKQRYDQEYDLSRDEQPWEPAEDDTLLTAWLAGRPLLGPDSVVARCHRSPDGVKTRLWKLLTCYHQEGRPVVSYVSGGRASRQGALWTERDDYVLSKATSVKGIENKASDPTYLAGLLARTEEEIVARMNSLACSALGLWAGTRQLTFLETAALVHRKLASLAHRLDRQLTTTKETHESQA